ncbi:uncharacterized protein LOC135366070 [Ornithodoros turicata]|uniref:uncharacterized protein LOC135366070 n=1 Tax=Ornithodoros turicata TaxID=34597 RepID=UPI0031395162
MMKKTTTSHYDETFLVLKKRNNGTVAEEMNSTVAAAATPGAPTLRPSSDSFRAVHMASPLIIFALLLSYSYPFVFMASMAQKKVTSDFLDIAISVVSGVGLVHWLLRMVPYTKMINELMSCKVHADSLVVGLGCLSAYAMNCIIAMATDQWLLKTGKSMRQKYRQGWKVQRYVPWNEGYLYKVRSLSGTVYLMLVLTASTFAFVDGFSIGVFIQKGTKLLYPAVAQEMLASTMLGVLALRTRCTRLEVVQNEVIFASAMSSGLLFGASVGEKGMYHLRYAVLGTVASLSSGMFIAVVFGQVVLPEIIRRDRGTSVLAMTLGALISGALVFPMFDI